MTSFWRSPGPEQGGLIDMEALNLAWCNIKWRFQNPATIMMTLIQPLTWLLLFSTLFGARAGTNYPAFILPGIW